MANRKSSKIITKREQEELARKIRERMLKFSQERR